MDLMDRLYNRPNKFLLRPSTLILPPCLPESTYLPEALSSFIIRLSSSHHISVGQLVREFIQPRILSQQRGHLLHRCHDGYTINGASSIGWELFEAVNGLVAHIDNSQYCNFYFLRSLLGRSYKNLMSKQMRWCPLCISEEHSCYYPLYWHSLSVSCCIKHKIKLISMCPSCHVKMNVLSATTTMNRCSSCNAPLAGGVGEKVKLIDADEKDVWIADNINKLAINHLKLSQLSLLEIFRHNLQKICIEYRSISNAERRLGFSESLFQQWLTRNRPNFPEFVELGYRLNIPLLDLLTPTSKTKISTCYLFDQSSPEEKPKASHQLILSRLGDVIDRQENISIKALAKELGKSEGYLQYHFRILLNEIIQIRIRHVQHSRKEQQEKLFLDAATAAIMLMIQGKYFGGRNMTRSLSERVGHKKLSNKRLLKFIYGEIRNRSENLPIALCDKLSPAFNEES